MKWLAICTALQWEARATLKALGAVEKITLDRTPIWRTTGKRSPVLVARVGMGPERARKSAESLMDRFEIDALLAVGCAGALSPDLRPGDLVIPDLFLAPLESRVASHAADASWNRTLRRAAATAGLSTQNGVILSLPTVLATMEDKRAAHARFGAVAVEMESAALAELAAERGVAFAGMRVILDDASTDLPVETFSTISPRVDRIMEEVIRSPGKLRTLWRLGRAALRAQEVLHRFAKALLQESQRPFDDRP